MPTFFYKVRGSVGEYNVGFLESDSESSAKKTLETIYGNVEKVFIDESEFKAIEEVRGQDLTHNVKDKS